MKLWVFFHQLGKSSQSAHFSKTKWAKLIRHMKNTEEIIRYNYVSKYWNIHHLHTEKEKKTHRCSMMCLNVPNFSLTFYLQTNWTISSMAPAGSMSLLCCIRLVVLALHPLKLIWNSINTNTFRTRDSIAYEMKIVRSIIIDLIPVVYSSSNHWWNIRIFQNFIC